MRTAKVVEIQQVWLLTKDAEAYSGLSDGTLLKMAGKGEIRMSRVKGKNYYDRNSIDKVFEKNVIKTA